jgi:hypothetical protein
MDELKCPLCGCRFLTIDDLTVHLSTHKAQGAESPAHKGVSIVEVGVGGLREVAATVVSAVKDCNCELCKRAAEKARFKPRRPRWHLTLRPVNDNYKDFHVWIAADSAYMKDPSTAGKGTQLGDYVVRLMQLGLKGGTVDALLAETVGKTFLWERAKIGRRQRETWIPKKLLSMGGAEREADPVEACAERMASALERGRAYSIDETMSVVTDFPSDVVEKAWELLAKRGKAFKLPTKPVKYFYEG